MATTSTRTAAAKKRSASATATPASAPRMPRAAPKPAASRAKAADPAARKKPATKSSAAPAARKTRSTVTTRTTAAVAAPQAKRAAIAKAKKVAPKVAAHIGSTPQTKYRGNPDIFGRLVEDHDHHRALLAMITDTKGDSPDRKKLFNELVKELKSHAAAEEQALWSSVMRNPKTTDDARHAVGEHKEIDKMLDDLAARDMSSSGWLRRFAGLHEEYLHHIKEEEQEQFVAAQKHLTPTDIRYMKQVFNRRKAEEKAAAKVTPKLRKKAH